MNTKQDQKTEKVYYQDPYQSELKTYVTGYKKNDRGHWYTFEKSIFYPEGGGQSSDKGWVNGDEVIEVNLEDENIWHLMDKKLPHEVSLKLNWHHRYSNMQQHTGQHVLSAVFKRLFNYDTESVHLGSDDTLIELNTPDISQKQLKQVEDLANEMIRQNLTVTSIWITKRELEQYNFRRDIKFKSEPIRLIQIADLDCTGCGGTHVKFTCEIGLIKVLKTERIRQRTRVQTKMGSSAYRYFSLLDEKLQHLSGLLSTGIEEIPSRVDKLLYENRDLNKKNKEITVKWLKEFAKQLQPQESLGVFLLEGLSSEHLTHLSLLWSEIHKTICFFISRIDGRCFFVLRSLKGHDKTADKFIKLFSSQFELRGGGSNEFTKGIITADAISASYLSDLKKQLGKYFFI